MDLCMECDELCGKFRAKAAGLLLLATLVLALISSFAFVIVVSGIRSRLPEVFNQFSDEEITSLLAVAGNILNLAIMAGVTLVVLKLYFPGETTAAIVGKFGLNRTYPTRDALISFLLGIVIVLAFRKVLMVVFQPDEFASPHPRKALLQGSIYAEWIFAILAITLIPIVEEFFFRGVLYKGFCASWNKIFAAIVVSVIFIALHPDTLSSGYWVTHLMFCVVAFLFVFARVVTGSLMSPIFIHSGANFASVIIP